jgi:Putative zinc-finger
LLTEGRQAFLRRVSGIERGAECARYEPLLSALADGEASPEQLAALRPHMRTCLSCRARLREFRATPELVPPAALVVADGGGPLRSLVESVVGAAQQQSAVLGDRFQAAAELATGQKLAAVAASAAALAGGGTAIDEFANHQGPPLPEPVPQVEAQPVKEEIPVEPAPPLTTETAATEVAPEAPAPAPEPPPPPPPDPADEFTPGASAPVAAGSPAPAARPQPADGELSSGGGGGAQGGGGGGEFAP